jgi:hypothetical protein
VENCVEFVPRLKLQPYRVWFDNNIIWYARTEQEAIEKLQQARIEKREAELVTAKARSG